MRKAEKQIHTLGKGSRGLSVIVSSQEAILLIFIILLIGFIGICSKNFFTAKNFVLIMRQMPINLVIAIGMTIALVSGGIDLSVGSILGVSALAAGIMMQEYSIPVIISILITIVIATILGYVNGLLIAKLRVEPIIVTLGTMNIYKGIAYVFTNGQWYTKFPEEFLGIGEGLKLFIIGLVVTALFFVIMKHTRFGKHVYAIGGSETSSRLAGLKVNRIKILVYTLIGALCGVAGVMYVARTASASATAGSGYEMDAIAACVIGGVSITGGKGKIIGTFLGAVLLAVIFNGMTLLSISADWQGIVTALIIILALLLGSFRKRFAGGANS